MSVSCTVATAALLTLSACAAPAQSTADPITLKPASQLSDWTLIYAPYTYHYSEARVEHAGEPDVKHAYVWLIGAEKELGDNYLAGLSYFNNSFGQPSAYGFWGRRFKPLDSLPNLYVKATVGIIYGYKQPYHRKIPLNSKNGWAFSAIPSVGYQINPNWSAQLNLLGTAGLMVQMSYRFDASH